MRNILVVENPNAGRHRARHDVTALLQALTEAGLSYAHDVSIYKGYLQEKYPKGMSLPYTDVIACGGDGTLHDVVNVFAERDVVITVFPIGSANDFYLDSADHYDRDQLINRILQEEIHHVDLIRLNDHYFINNAGIGLDAWTLEIMERARNYFSGKFAYQSSALAAIASYRAQRGRFTIDGVSYEREFMLATLCNARWFGGGMMISPHSDKEDGVMELILLNRTSKRHLLSLFRKIFNGDHMKEERVEIFRGTKITVETERSMRYHCEGELLGHTPLQAELIPGALRMIF